MLPPPWPQPAPGRLWLQHDSQNLLHHSRMGGEPRGFGFFCFGQLKRILVLPDSLPSPLLPPLFLWAACISDSCEGCNGHFAEGAIWTPAGWCLMLAHSGFQKVALLRAATQLHRLLRIPLITLNYIGQPLPHGGHPSLRTELS